MSAYSTINGLEERLYAHPPRLKTLRLVLRAVNIGDAEESSIFVVTLELFNSCRWSCRKALTMQNNCLSPLAKSSGTKSSLSGE